MIDEIGGRGRVVGDAQVSEQHCNFMINRGKASAADIETLVSEVSVKKFLTRPALSCAGK